MFTPEAEVNMDCIKDLHGFCITTREEFLCVRLKMPPNRLFNINRGEGGEVYLFS